MLSAEAVSGIIYWFNHNGGHPTRAAGHAMKLLGEVIELAYASGCTEAEVRGVVDAQTKQAHFRQEITGTMNRTAMSEESADVAILLTVLATMFGLCTESSVRIKLSILNERQWQADLDGVLRRPGRTNT